MTSSLPSLQDAGILIRDLEPFRQARPVWDRAAEMILAPFTFTPTHGSWLNLIEGFFSKLTRSVLRHIRVASKEELKGRIMAAMDEFNRHPVVHTWSYKLDQAA
jgi:transposase